MLDDCAEIFDRYHNMKFILHIDIIKLISLYGDGCLKRFLQDSILTDSLLTETSKIHMIAIGVNVEKLDARAEMVHQLSQCP